MRILVAGDYDPTYNRTRIVLSGLRAIGVEVEEFIFSKRLSGNEKPILKAKAEVADIIYCPPFTHSSVKHIKRLSSKPLVFDPLISKYMTKVFDYKQVSRFSPRAIKNYYKDKIPMKLSDVIIADTHEHKKYFISKFKVPEQKIEVLPIGVIKEDFVPGERKKNTRFNVGFYGGFIPLQGVGKIIEAANILKQHDDITFSLIGDGFEFDKIQKQVEKYQLQNVELKGYVKYEALADLINNFDLCLGIFGDTMKAELVIPNKVYHYAALGKCIVTKDTAAIKELFRNEESILFTSNDPSDMASMILALKDNAKLREKIGRNAYQLIAVEHNEKEIAKKFIAILEKQGLR